MVVSLWLCRSGAEGVDRAGVFAASGAGVRPVARAGPGHGPAAPVDIDEIFRHARPFLSPHLAGEAILTIGSALSEIATSVCGVISIGPFGCMPSRLAEAILTDTMRSPVKTALTPGNRALKKTLADFDELPFLSIESDGSPFPQLLEAKLDAFCLGASRLNDAMVGPQRR